MGTLADARQGSSGHNWCNYFPLDSIKWYLGIAQDLGPKAFIITIVSFFLANLAVYYIALIHSVLFVSWGPLDDVSKVQSFRPDAWLLWHAPAMTPFEL